jgi:small-conductance mechanosensitive channel
MFRSPVGFRIFTLLTGLVLFNAVHAQSLLQNQERSSNRNDTVEVIQPIPLGELNSASSAAISLFSRTGSGKLKPAERNQLKEDTDSLVSQVNVFIADTAEMILDQLNFRQLEVINNMLVFLSEQISDIQKGIDRRLADIQSSQDQLARNRKRWVLTSESISRGTAPETVTRRIRNTIYKNDSVFALLQNDIDFLLTQSDRLTSQQIRLDQFELELEDQERERAMNVLQRDMPPLWLSRNPADSLSRASFWENFSSNFRDDSNLMAAEYSGRMILVVCLFILLIAVVFWLKATVKASEIQEKKLILSLYLNEIFKKPLAVTLLLVLYLARLIMPEIPASYSAIIALLATYAVLRIALEILPMNYKKFLIGFAISYVLLRLYNLFYDQYLPGRLLLLASQSISIGFLIVFLMRRHRTQKMRRSLFNHMLSALSVLFLFFLFVAAAGNVIGALSLSEYLSSGIIRSAFLVLSTYVGFHVLAAVFYLFMSSNLLQQSHIIRAQFDYLFGRLYAFLRLLFTLSWIFISLDNFNVRDPFFHGLGEFMNQPIEIGKASFSLMSIFLFLFVIWLSLFISRIIRHVLQEEVFTRIEIKRGLPGTIIMLLRIILVSIGFLLAAAAAGIKLDSLAIILGAFSVGIGFGLQNIFNNLVSGLILAFERPIKAGDIVEVNNLLGTVKQIGIRSSVVKTFDGAEVIVPNGELISNDLINWTLSDQFRRADIRVGVKYGTAPKKVTELLLEVAQGNPRVLNDPAPRAYFIDFGDSSLNFRLLAWIDQDHRLEVESELRIEIDEKLKEAGIEIPFPQHDLHVRSVDRDILDGLGREK